MSPLDAPHMDDELAGWNASFEANREYAPASKPATSNASAAMPFRCLGHDRGKYFFLTAGGGQVITMTAKDVHSLPMLTTLAPLSWWEAAYPGGKDSFLVRAAGDAMMRSCEKVGIFDPERTRGRGVWLDNGKVVLHLGDVLRVNGADTAPSQFESRYIYEQTRAIEIPLAEPLTDAEATKLVRLCCEIAWEDRDRDGRLLAGFMVCALLCGGMPWRPHMWLTGESGEGKSWVTVSELIGACLGRSEIIMASDADAALRRSGMLVKDGRFLIANRSEFVADRFRSTRWASGWSRTMTRATGAQRGVEQRYTVAHKDKSLAIPLPTLIGEAEE